MRCRTILYTYLYIMDKDIKKRYWVSFLIIGIVLVVDQLVKVLVKTNMQIGEDIPLIGEWCRLHFVENEGMAFGMSFGGKVGKLLLSLFRLLASGAIMWYLLRLIKRKESMLVIVSLALIFVGAVGNLVDSCFYGLIFNESYFQVATMFPEGGGYGHFFMGRVVDMFYFPLIDTTWPEWMPFVGGNRFEFFNAIFNVADSAITIGVGLLLVNVIFSKEKEAKFENSDVETSENSPSLKKED